MTQPIPDQKFEQVVQKVVPQSKLLRAWELKGGVSAQVTALEIERPDGQPQKMIVRQHGARDLKQNPHIAKDEFMLLRIVQSVDLRAPTPYYCDETGEIFATPYIVIEYIEGETEFAPANLPDAILQLATCLSKIHTADYANVDLSFLPQQDKRYAIKMRERPDKLDESLDEGRIRDTLESVWPLSQRNTSVLLHGDFWPGNVLWKNDQLAAVIDWEDAEFGDPLADFANSRLEILFAFGFDAMHRFTEHYTSQTAIDFTNLPYWDLCAALRPAGKLSEWFTDEKIEKAVRDKHKVFVTQAYEKIAALTSSGLA